MKKEVLMLALSILVFTCILAFLLIKTYPQEYENLKVFLFTNDVFYKVTGGSMLPTLRDKQMWYGSPCENDACRNTLQRGDIVVLDTSKVLDIKDIFIKRVIGVPLDRVMIAKGKVYVNDHLLIEPYTESYTITPPGSEGCLRFHLGTDQAFVLGDNRAHSDDSRSFGPVSVSSIFGVSRFEKYNSPDLAPRLDSENVISFDEKECPLWRKP